MVCCNANCGAQVFRRQIMKTIAIFSLIVGGLLLIGFRTQAQSHTVPEADRDWIDSMAVQYRSDYREAVLKMDSAALGRLYKRLEAMIVDNCKIQDRTKRSDIDDAVIFYAREHQAFRLKKRLYAEEKKEARTDFSIVF